jgi:hypothetical protein
MARSKEARSRMAKSGATKNEAAERYGSRK